MCKYMNCSAKIIKPPLEGIKFVRTYFFAWIKSAGAILVLGFSASNKPVLSHTTQILCVGDSLAVRLRASLHRSAYETHTSRMA